MIFYSLPRSDLVYEENRVTWQLLLGAEPPGIYRYGHKFTEEQALTLAQLIEDNNKDSSITHSRDNLINFLRKSGGFEVW